MLKINRKLSKKGFTLVELMVAVAILGVAALGIFQAYQVGFWGMSDARARTIATNIAREKLEEIKGKSLAAGTYPDPGNPIVVSGKNFNVVIDVIDIIEGGFATTLKRIITTVSWQKRNAEETNIIVEGLQSKALAPSSTDVPTAILISANPHEMDIGDTSTIQVTILDKDNYPIGFEGKINLSMIPNTLGTLGDIDLVFNGESFLTTTFTAGGGGAGDVEINAVDNAGALFPDSETITIIGGEPVSIDISADPESVIINKDTSVLTVRIEDINGFLADKWTGIVEITITSGQDTGDLGDSPAGDTITIEFNDENLNTTLFTSSAKAGTAVITASDQADVLTEDSETIYVTSGPPHHIDIEAEPNSIFIPGYEGGATSSTITVTIKNETDVPVGGFIGTVSLNILSGSESGSLAVGSLTFNGEISLSTIFTSTTTPGNVLIKASAEPLGIDTESLTVATGPPEYLEIAAVPDIILNDGSDSSTLTIVLKDFNENYSSFDEDKNLTFSLSPDEGIVKNIPLKLLAGNSQISTTYVCANSEFEGDVDITVTCVTCEGISGGSTATVQVAQKIIRPSENPNIQYGGQWVGWWIWRRWEVDPSKVLFDFDVLGGVIDITQIDLAWKEGTPLEGLQGITIYEKDDEDNVKIERTWSYPYPLIPIFEEFYEIYSGFSVNQSLDNIIGTYTMELNYNRDIKDRIIVIQFHGTYEGRVEPIIYQLEFLSPDLIV